MARIALADISARDAPPAAGLPLQKQQGLIDDVDQPYYFHT